MCERYPADRRIKFDTNFQGDSSVRGNALRRTYRFVTWPNVSGRRPSELRRACGFACDTFDARRSARRPSDPDQGGWIEVDARPRRRRRTYHLTPGGLRTRHAHRTSRNRLNLLSSASGALGVPVANGTTRSRSRIWHDQQRQYPHTRDRCSPTPPLPLDSLPDAWGKRASSRSSPRDEVVQVVLRSRG